MPEGTFAIHLSRETQERFEVVADWHLSQLEPQKEIPLEVLQAEVAERKESTDFFAFADEIKNCRLLAPLLIYDPSEQYGEKYLLCLSGEAKYGYLQNEEDANMALVDDESPYEYKYRNYLALSNMSFQSHFVGLRSQRRGNPSRAMN